MKIRIISLVSKNKVPISNTEFKPGIYFYKLIGKNQEIFIDKFIVVH